MNKFVKGKITGYGYDGEGVCRVDGKVCFVPFTLKDEIVEFGIVKDTSSFSKGEIVTIEEKSDEREIPQCPYYTKCGGCTYQHTNYDNEIKIKKDLLKGHMAKLGFNDEILVIKSPKKYDYRNKIKLFVGDKEIGLKYRGSDKICDIEKCLISDRLINEAIEDIRTFFKAQNLYKYFSEIIIRSENNSCLINFIMASFKNINYQGLQLMLGHHFGIFQTFKGKTKHILGLKSLEVKEFDLDCEFSPNSFHQINPLIAQDLYKDVLTQIKGDNVINCYSGAGVLSGIIAKQNKRVIGIELGINEHNDAEILKENNNLFYLTNMQGDCAEIIPKLMGTFSTIIVDPPRTGMDKKVCQSINSKDCERLIYISCNSATLVRDLSRLDKYKIKMVKLYDMFPRTGEYETLVVLDKI